MSWRASSSLSVGGPWKARLVRWAWRGGSLLALLALLDYVVLPHLTGAEKSLALLSSVEPGWVAAGVVLEAASLASYSMLSRSILNVSGVGYFWLLRMDLTALGLSHVVPGGVAPANALRFRLLREAGADEGEVGVGLALEGIGSTATLLALLWVSLAAHVVVFGPNLAFVLATALGAALVVAIVVAVRGRSRFAAPLSNFGRGVAVRLPRRTRPTVARLKRALMIDLERLMSDPSALRACAVWAVCNWLFDAAALWMFLAAFGQRMDPVGLLVAYGLANAAATLPLTPGGLGIVEGAMIPSLVAYGTPASIAVLGVVSWRLFEFWAPIPVAGLCYLSLRLQGRRSTSG